MMICKTVTLVCFSRLPEDMKIPCLMQHPAQYNHILMALDRACLDVLLTTPVAAELTAWIGVGGCLCPIS